MIKQRRHPRTVRPSTGRSDPSAARQLVDPAAADFARVCGVLREFQSYGFDVTDPLVAERAVITSRHRDRVAAHEGQLIGRRFGPTPPPMSASSVVYYMRIGNRCKIGFTTDLAARMAAFYPEEILAVEPGGVLKEGERHRQFRELRTVGEWFRYEAALVEHVAGLRAAGAAR